YFTYKLNCSTATLAAISSFFSAIPTVVTSAFFTNNNSDSVDNSENSIKTTESESSMNDQNLPITGICLVSNYARAPPGYQCIRKTHDDSQRDADLMADKLLERKDRFLCITRIYPLADNVALVLEDIKLINERDLCPPGYQLLSYTVDTREKGTTKRSIAVKLISRQAGMKSINDIIFLYRTKRPPPSYTMIGEINGLTMCIKEGTVPPFRQTPNPPTQTAPHSFDRQQSIYDSAAMQRHAQENSSIEGIPFLINPKYLKSNKSNGNSSSNDLAWLDSFQILSLREIEQKYHYDFSLERSYDVQ
ncbi:unnamed protein product, partial [Didymodactylos carnosus]